MPLTASSGTTRSSGNKLIVVYCRRSWSNTDRLFRHDASCLSLISPRYRTVRCAIWPVDNRRLSTTLKYRWSFPSFFRVVLRRYICKVTADDTGGAYSLAIETTPAHGGLPLHVHHREDEAM